MALIPLPPPQIKCQLCLLILRHLVPDPIPSLMAHYPPPPQPHAPSSLGVLSPLLPLGLCTCCPLCQEAFTPSTSLPEPSQRKAPQTNHGIGSSWGFSPSAHHGEMHL